MVLLFYFYFLRILDLWIKWAYCFTVQYLFTFSSLQGVSLTGSDLVLQQVKLAFPWKHCPFRETYTFPLLLHTFFLLPHCSRIKQLFILSYNTRPSISVWIFNSSMTKYLFEMARAHFSRCTTPQTLHDHQASLTRGGCQRRLTVMIPYASLMSSDITTTSRLYIIDHLLFLFFFINEIPNLGCWEIPDPSDGSWQCQQPKQRAEAIRVS